MTAPQGHTPATLIAACLARLRMVAEAPAQYPTFFREEIGLEVGGAAVDAEAAAALGVGVLHFFIEDELSGDDPELSGALVAELRRFYGLPDAGLTTAELDQDSDDWDLDHIFGLLNEIATQMFARDAAGWFEQGGREQLMDALQQYSASIPGRLRLQG